MRVVIRGYGNVCWCLNGFSRYLFVGGLIWNGVGI